jgi:hypothetical protein
MPVMKSTKREQRSLARECPTWIRNPVSLQGLIASAGVVDRLHLTTKSRPLIITATVISQFNANEPPAFVALARVNPMPRGSPQRCPGAGLSVIGETAFFLGYTGMPRKG